MFSDSAAKRQIKAGTGRQREKEEKKQVFQTERFLHKGNSLQIALKSDTFSDSFFILFLQVGTPH